jgi:two-component system phosphate regulon sensor histidine kinase PhoR
MARPPIPLRHILGTVTLLALPLAIGLVALAALGRLDPLAALLAFLAIGAALALLSLPLLGGLADLAAYLEAAAEGRDEALPDPRWPPTLVMLASAAARLRRRWLQRRGEFEARIAALDAMLDSLPDPLLTLDSRLRVVGANLAAKELLPDQPIGRDLSAVLRVPALLEAAQAAFRAGEGAAPRPAAGGRVEFELGHPVRRSLVARIERLAGLHAEPALLVVLHDVTQEKRAEQMRADFVANASHEMRTPLATLLGFIETLQGAASEDAATRARFLGIMQQQASRMSRLVDDLLSLSRIELHEHAPPTEQVDLLRVLRGVGDALQPQSQARGIAIEIEPAEGELPPVTGDPDELAQVFQNLIDNGLKYGRRGTVVRVALRPVPRAPVPLPRIPASGLVAVAVSDEGEGIPREQIPRLTERFYRIDAARSRELGGTGLGLAIVKHIVNRHRGALAIESELGRGSVFTVFLPAAGAR